MEKFPEDQFEHAEGKIWYLSHYGVFHPQKGNLHVVFDCGAEFKGTLLKRQLPQEPNLTI